MSDNRPRRISLSLSIADLPAELRRIAAIEKRRGRPIWPAGFFDGPDGPRRLRAVLDAICEIEGIEPSRLTARLFHRYALSAAVNTHFRSVYHMINSLWPGRYEPWEVGDYVGQNAWGGEYGLEVAARATWWLSARLRKPVEELTKADFVSAGLSSMLVSLFAAQPYRARENALNRRPAKPKRGPIYRDYRKRAVTNLSQGPFHTTQIHLPEELHQWLTSEVRKTPRRQESRNDIIILAIQEERRRREMRQQNEEE